MKKLLVLLLSAWIVAGCANQGGNVDVQSVQQQADKEKAINKKAMESKPLPPGEGPSG